MRPTQLIVAATLAAALGTPVLAQDRDERRGERREEHRDDRFYFFERGHDDRDEDEDGDRREDRKGERRIEKRLDLRVPPKVQGRVLEKRLELPELRGLERRIVIPELRVLEGAKGAVPGLRAYTIPQPHTRLVVPAPGAEPRFHLELAPGARRFDVPAPRAQTTREAFELFLDRLERLVRHLERLVELLERLERSMPRGGHVDGGELI